MRRPIDVLDAPRRRELRVRIGDGARDGGLREVLHGHGLPAAVPPDRACDFKMLDPGIKLGAEWVTKFPQNHRFRFPTKLPKVPQKSCSEP